MNTAPIGFEPTGDVRSPAKHGAMLPAGKFSGNISGIVIEKKNRPALWRINGQNHPWILCWLNRADRSVPRAIPPGTSAGKGVTAIRSPDRLNPVSLSLVDLIGINNDVLQVRGLDTFDGTPIIDIRGYPADIDCAKKNTGRTGDVFRVMNTGTFRSSGDSWKPAPLPFHDVLSHSTLFSSIRLRALL